MTNWEDKARQIIAEAKERSQALDQAIADLEREMTAKTLTGGQSRYE